MSLKTPARILRGFDVSVPAQKLTKSESDHDGVLVDTEYWYFKATQRGIAELGINQPLEGYRQHLVDGGSGWDIAREQGVLEEDCFMILI